MKDSNNNKSKDSWGRNEKYYPLLFFLVLPLAGFFSASDYGWFNGDQGKGIVFGLTGGVILYAIYKYMKRMG